MLIQIVDDSPNMREAIKTVLSGMNVKFIEADNGEHAVAQFAEQQPDLVIMDIRMGNMDGIGATRRIRQHLPHAQVIILTQYDDNDLRMEAQHAGAIAYVLKDDLSQLLTIMKSFSKDKV